MKKSEMLTIALSVVAIILSAYSLFLAKENSEHGVKITIANEIEKTTKSILFIKNQARILNDKVDSCLESSTDKDKVIWFTELRRDARTIPKDAQQVLEQLDDYSSKSDSETLFFLKNVFNKHLVLESKIKRINSKLKCK